MMYLSILMDSMEKRHPRCTQHAAGVAKAIQKTAHIVMGHPLHILTTHGIVAYVNSQVFTMTSLRQQRLSKILSAPNLQFTHEGINMADHMSSGELHECTHRAITEDKPRPDLRSEPIPGAQDLFTDGCCFRQTDGTLQAGYAVVIRRDNTFFPVEARKLEKAQSAQRAEVLALTAALKAGQGQKVNIYSDSAYAVGAAQVELGQCKRAGFRTAGNKPIKHEQEMRDLAEALLLPLEVAIIKCKGHDMSNTLVARGNHEADQAAKQAAGYTPATQMVSIEEELAPPITIEEIIKAQKGAGPLETRVWTQRGGTCQDGLWRGPDGRIILPPGIRKRALIEAHGLGHV